MTIQGQAETEIYVGERGHIVIKQPNYEGEDDVVFISPEFATQFASIITKLAPDAIKAREEWETNGDNE